MLTSDVLQADIIFVECLDLRLEITAQKAHQKIDFRLGALFPVLLGEGVEGQRGDSDAGGGFDCRTHSSDTGAMSGYTGHVAAPGPASIPVHDDGDMPGKARPIEPQVEVSFLAVHLHSSRNRMSQAELSESKLTHEIQCVQCDRRDGGKAGGLAVPTSFAAKRDGRGGGGGGGGAAAATAGRAVGAGT